MKYQHETSIHKLKNELKSEKQLRSEYQKTIDVTGKNFNMMNTLETTQPTHKVVYRDRPMHDFDRYSMYLGYLVEVYYLVYLAGYVYKLFY